VQLEQYIRQNVAQPQRVQTPQVQGAAVNRPDLPNTPGDPVEQEDYSIWQSALNLGEKVVNFFNEKKQTAQKLKANELFNASRSDGMETVANAVATNNIEEAQEQIGAYVDDRIEQYSEELDETGMALFRGQLEDYLYSVYDDQVLSDAQTERKQLASSYGENLEMYLSDGNYDGAVKVLINGIGDNIWDQRDLGIAPEFWDIEENPYTAQELGESIEAGDNQKVLEVLKYAHQRQAIEGVFDSEGSPAKELIEKTGLLGQVMRETEFNNALNEINVMAETSQEYAQIKESLSEKDEEGNFVAFPEITSLAEREKLLQYTDNKYKDADQRETRELQAFESGILNTLNDEFHSFELTMEDLQQASEQVQTPSARAEVRTLRNGLEQRMNNSKIEKKEEALNRFAGFDKKWRLDVAGGKYTIEENIERYKKALNTYTKEHQRVIMEDFNLTSAIKFAQGNAQKIKRTGIYEEIDKLKAPNDVKNRMKTNVIEYMTDAIYDDDRNIKEDAPSMDQLQIGARNIINEIAKSVEDEDVIERIEQAFGTVSQEYSRDKFIKFSTISPKAGWKIRGIERGGRNDWQTGLRMINEGFLLTTDDPEEIEALTNYHSAITDLYVEEFGEQPQDYKINGGQIFFKDKKGISRTLMMPPGGEGGEGQPQWVTAYEFAKYYFTPGTILKDLGVDPKLAEGKLFEEYGNITGYGVVQKDAIYTGEGWKKIDDVKDSFYTIDEQTYLEVAGNYYPVSVLEQ